MLVDGLQQLRESPVRLEPVGRPGDRIAEAALYARMAIPFVIIRVLVAMVLEVAPRCFNAIMKPFPLNLAELARRLIPGTLLV